MESKDTKKMTSSIRPIMKTQEFGPLEENLTTKEDDESLVVEEMVNELIKRPECEIKFPPLESMHESSPSLSLSSQSFSCSINGMDENSNLAASVSKSSVMASITNVADIDIMGTTEYLRGVTDCIPPTMEWTIDENDLYWQVGGLPGATDVNDIYDEWLAHVLSDPSFEFSGGLKL
ncbi:hypothetical protein MRB53_030639 [Persea americana]|uniref:Uncharacterized protein n=1 Tax=Persea americana TaxID=3435 RepID=A0ACC2KLT9_PERAE|nr:hypothetical protein MRB53_030639 [Persea americana]